MTIGYTQQNLVNLQHQTTGGPAVALMAPDKFLDLRDIFGILRRRSRVIMVCVMAATLAAIAYLLLVPPTYTAMSVVLIDPRETRVISSEDVLSGIGSDTAALESQVELIESTTLAGRIVDELKLEEDTEFAPGPLRRWLVGTFGTKARAAHERNKVVEQFRRRLNVNRRGLTYVFEVGFTSEDAAKAARIANAVTNAYLDDQLGAKHDATTKASDWLEERVETLREAMRDSDQKVAAFKAEHNIVEFIGGGNGSDLNQRQIDEINRQLTLARANTAEAQAKHERVKQFSGIDVDPGSLSDALTSEVIKELRVQYATLASTEAEYRLTYSDNHPRLQNVRSQLANMRAQIDQEIERILTGAKNDYEIAVSRERSLSADLKKLKEEKAEANRWNVELQSLEREAKANQRLLEQFLDRLKETTAQTSLQKPDARVVSEAQTPIEPNGPGALLILLFAGVGGLALGGAGTVVTESLDSSFRTRSGLEASLSVPCFGLCPAVEPRELIQVAKARAKTERDRSMRRHLKSPRGIADTLSRYAVLRPKSPFGEAICAAFWGLWSDGGSGNGKMPNVLLISSALQHEGKSTIAANIAHCSAKSGALTLLIDADARSGALSELMAPNVAFGLTDVLHNVVALEEAVTLDPDTGLYMLSFSETDRQVQRTGLLNDDKLKEFLDRQRETFDLIVIDSPPVLPVPEARSLFGLADAVLMVVEWGGTAQDAVVAALNAVGTNREKIAGTVFNKVDTGSYRFYEPDYT